MREQERARLATSQSALRRDPFQLCLLLLIVITLSKFGGYFGILRILRPSLVLFAICAGYAFLNPRKLELLNLSRGLTVRLVGALGIVVLGSIVFGISQGHAGVFFLNNFSKTLIITGLIIGSIRELRDVRRLCWAFAIGGILLAYLSIFLIGISKVSTGVTYDANDVGVFMVMTLPLALLLLQTSRTRFPRWFSVVGIALIGSTIVKTQSRGAFIGVLVVGAALLVMLPGISVLKRVVFVVTAAVTMMFSAPPGYWKSMQSILDDPKSDYNWDSINGRRNLAKRGIGYMISYPVFGIGVDNFRMAEGTISEKARTAAPGTGVRWASPHNSFVQAGAEAGLPGLLLWVALVLSNMITPRVLRRRMPRGWHTGTPDQRFLSLATLYVPIAQLGFAVTAFFVSFAWMEPLYFLSALVAGLTIIIERELRPFRPPPIVPGFRTIRSYERAESASTRALLPPQLGS